MGAHMSNTAMAAFGQRKLAVYKPANLAAAGSNLRLPI